MAAAKSCRCQFFDAFMRDEIVKWGKVIKQIGTMDN
jgi:hypothetical protein